MLKGSESESGVTSVSSIGRHSIKGVLVLEITKDQPVAAKALAFRAFAVPAAKFADASKGND